MVYTPYAQFEYTFGIYTLSILFIGKNIMPSNKPKVVVYTTEELKAKLEFIAKENNRSASSETEMLIKKHIRQYEEYNGEIDISKE